MFTNDSTQSRRLNKMRNNRIMMGMESGIFKSDESSKAFHAKPYYMQSKDNKNENK